MAPPEALSPTPFLLFEVVLPSKGPSSRSEGVQKAPLPPSPAEESQNADPHPISPERRGFASRLPSHSSGTLCPAGSSASSHTRRFSYLTCNFELALLALQEGSSGVAKIALPDAPL